jgi:hypothetical protein
MRRKVAELLKAYVRQGAWIVADARTATLDEFDFAYQISPGAGLEELFGATRPDWTGQKTHYKIHMNESEGRPAFDFEGRFFREKLRLRNNATTMGTFVDNGGPAVIRNHYGNGIAILSAVPLGASYYDRPTDPVDRVLVGAAKDAGVAPDAMFLSKENSFLNLKVHVLKDNVIVYAINSGDHPVSGIISVNVEGAPVRRGTDIITGKSVPFVQKERSIAIPVEAESHKVFVFLLER